MEVHFAGALQFTEHFSLQGDPSADQCPAELLYGDSSEETELLRCLRDSFLRQGPEGRAITALYYRYSPVIVHLLREDGELQQEVKILADAVLGLLKPPAQGEDNSISMQAERQLLGLIQRFK